MQDWRKLRVADEPKAGPKVALRLPTDQVIGSTSQMQRLARLLVCLDIPRREVPEWISNLCYSFEGRVEDSYGVPIDIDQDDLARSFNEDESYRWISDFVKWADRTPRQRAQERVIERLRYMTAAAAIYEFEYGQFNDSISSISPSSIAALSDRRENERALLNRVRFSFIAGLSVYQKIDLEARRKRNPYLSRRSLTLGAVACRYVMWLTTYIYPLLPKIVIARFLVR